MVRVEFATAKPRCIVPLQSKRICELGGGGASDAVLEEGDEFRGVAGGWKAGLPGANYG
jgi:hypothetical protein